MIKRDMGWSSTGNNGCRARLVSGLASGRRTHKGRAQRAQGSESLRDRIPVGRVENQAGSIHVIRPAAWRARTKRPCNLWRFTDWSAAPDSRVRRGSLTRPRAGDFEVAAGVLATARATWLAHAYVVAVRTLQERWRTQLGTSPGAPRCDAAAWANLDVLPAHPVLTAPAATAATQRATRSIYDAIEQLVAAGILRPLSATRRNRAWEADGLLDLMAELESGVVPAR